jgi:hypothetical protein
MPSEHPFRKAVITGVSCEPAWSDLSKQLRCVEYATVTCKATQERGFVVYAYALGSGQRVTGFKKLFPGAETVQKVGEFEECERYCRLKAEGLLKTLGDPLRKDAVRDKKRKAGDEDIDDRDHKAQKRDAEWLKAVMEDKVVTLCKQVEVLREELHNVPAFRKWEEAVHELKRMREIPTDSDAALEAHKTLALAQLEERERALKFEWLSKKHEYQAKLATYMELRDQLQQAMDTAAEKCRPATEQEYKLKQNYPIEDRDKWDPEEIDKSSAVVEQAKVMRRLHQWLLDWRARDDVNEYARIMRAPLFFDVENVKFTHVELMTKPGEKSVDWRNYGHKGRYERARNNTWKKVVKCGIDQVVMMVDKNRRNHQVLARSHVPMTWGEWNNVFDCAKMSVRDVITCLPLADLREPIRNAKEDDVKLFWLHTDEEIQERYLKRKAEMREAEMRNAKEMVEAVVPVAV